MQFEEVKDRLNSVVMNSDSLTSEKILQLSEEVDRYIVIEQRSRLEVALNEGLETKTK